MAGQPTYHHKLKGKLSIDQLILSFVTYENTEDYWEKSQRFLDNQGRPNDAEDWRDETEYNHISNWQERNSSDYTETWGRCQQAIDTQ